MRIGVFDSGVGGLTVLKSLLEKYPDNEYIYIGDNKNNPYGNKTKKELFNYSSRIIDYFIKEKVELVVVACNTICSTVLNKLKLKYDITIIGVIDATINEFIKNSYKSVLIIGTENTIKSNIYQNKINKIDNIIKVYSLSTPLLVPLIENNKNAKETLNNYIKDYDVESIILGCTHYKLLENSIPKRFKIIDSSTSIVNYIKPYIKDTNQNVLIYTTGDLNNFNKICYELLKINANILNI